MVTSVYCIAEIGINHNGNISLAKDLIDLAARAGCDAVKFQKRNIHNVYSRTELEKPRESPWGTTTLQQKEGLELSIDQYKILERHAANSGLDFIVSCWDLDSLNNVETELSVAYHKIASAMLTDKAFLEAINKTNKPVILSTGMSTQDEVDKAIKILKNTTHILACTSTYPTKPEDVNLAYINTLRRAYPQLKVGFSNHYSGLSACFAAVALGAEMLEFHITTDRTLYGSDQAASIEHVADLVSGVRAVEKMIGTGIKSVCDEEKQILGKLRKTNTI